MPSFKFTVKGPTMSTTIRCSYDVFSPNITEIYTYISELGGRTEDSTTATFNSDELAIQMVNKLQLLTIPKRLSTKR